MKKRLFVYSPQIMESFPFHDNYYIRKEPLLDKYILFFDNRKFKYHCSCQKDT